LCVKDALKIYAPSNDNNNPALYARILKRLGLDPDGKVGDQLEALSKGIKKVEGWIPGVTKPIDGGTGVSQIQNNVPHIRYNGPQLLQ